MCTSNVQVPTCRLQEAQTIAAAATNRRSKVDSHLDDIGKARDSRTARIDLIQRTLVPLQQEVDKLSMLLLGLQDSTSAAAYSAS